MGGKIEHPFRIDLWPLTGPPVRLATIESFDEAVTAYERACAEHPAAEITLRHGARVIHKQERQTSSL